MSESGWISVSDAAAKLGVSVDTIRRLVRLGELTGRPKTTLPGSSIMVSVQSVTKFDQKRSKK